jgi:medium-chain acyl-[acyl-carrier-protein] hydrolase
MGAMSVPPPRVWSENFKVHSYEVDFSQKATLTTLCRYFQEAAWNHAELLGVGYSRLQTDQKLWVLSRLLLKLEGYPRWGETVNVTTWPRSARSVFAMRDFRISDGAKKPLVAGTSAWLVLDVATRKPLRADKFLSHFTDLSEDKALERDPEKLTGCHARARESPSTSVAANYSDIDVNGHVTYAWYIGCVLDSYPAKFHQEYSPNLLEVNYLGETTCGEQVSVVSNETAPGERIHSILKSESGEEVCRIKVGWHKSLDR